MQYLIKIYDSEDMDKITLRLLTEAEMWVYIQDHREEESYKYSIYQLDRCVLDYS